MLRTRFGAEAERSFYHFPLTKPRLARRKDSFGTGKQQLNCCAVWCSTLNNCLSSGLTYKLEYKMTLK